MSWRVNIARAGALHPADPRAAEAKVGLYTGLFGEDRTGWPDR